MAALHSAVQRPSESVDALEMEIRILRLKLKKAEDTIHFLQNGIADNVERQHEKDSLQQSERRLELELADTDLIERTIVQEGLAQAGRYKDEFLATLAHELRNPLAPIRNALHIMRTAPESANTPALLDMMDRQVTHLVRLIDDLLDVSRLGQGKIDLRCERISFQRAVEDAVEASRPLIQSHNHTLTLHMPEQPLWINADLTRIAQIVGNLLNNAAKYTPFGGRITVTLTQDAAQAVLRVSDNGVGIPADMLPKVFDLFTQVDRNLDRSQGGLGIGLALVRQLLEVHAGEIKATSAGINQGSSFTVRLPLAEAAKADVSAQPSGIAAPAASGLRVLIVDDNAPSAQTIGWMMELDGHTYALARDASEALRAAETFRPDAILLDIGLPGMNGYDLCRALRKDPRFKNTLMIAQTGWGQERDRQLAHESGFDHHLIKPVNFDDLSKLLATASPA